jgi:hypothetical protein
MKQCESENLNFHVMTVDVLSARNYTCVQYHTYLRLRTVLRGTTFAWTA